MMFQYSWRGAIPSAALHLRAATRRVAQLGGSAVRDQGTDPSPRYLWHEVGDTRLLLSERRCGQRDRDAAAGADGGLTAVGLRYRLDDGEA
jgi:hypothetical protein